MTPQELTQAVGMVSAVALPFWNIPLIWRIQKRRSADDLSPAWALGVFTTWLSGRSSGRTRTTLPPSKNAQN